MKKLLLPLFAGTASAWLILPHPVLAQNYYAQQNIQREHDQYIQQQTERNTRYYKNDGDSDTSFTFQYDPPEPDPETADHIREEWERQQYARAHPLETGLAAYLATQSSDPELPRQQTHEEYAAQVKSVADSGDPAAKESYANCLYKGYGVPMNKAEAYRYYREASALRPTAEMQAAGMLINGDGVAKNFAEGMALMKHAAAAGNADAADYVMSVEGTYTDETVEASAAKGDFDPMMRLGVDYHNGENGRAEDNDKAFSYLKRAADGGNLQAMVFLGNMYEKGDGTPVDHAQAITWYLKADAAGEETAPFAICEYYRENGGATPEEILGWAQKAVAVEPVASNYLELGAVQLDQKDEVSARQNFAKAAELGSVTGLALTGIYEWRGVAGPLDAVNGYKHLMETADKGNARAFNELGQGYRDGENGLPVDLNVANAYFLKAAEGGYRTGQYNLALAYWSGNGVEQSYKHAGYWAVKAAAQDHPDAQYMMALLTQAGIGGVKDPARAVEWMEAAAANGSNDAIAKMAEGFDGQ